MTTRGRAPRRAPQQARSRETREAIVDAAEVLLREKGRDALALRPVMRAMGISVGTFYDHFPSKEALLFALEERTWAKVADAVRDELAMPAEPGPRSRAFRAIRRLVATLAERMALHGFTLDVHLPETMLAERAVRRAQVLELVAGAIASQGELVRVKNPSTAAFIVVAAVFQATRGAVDLRPDLVDSGEALDEIAYLALRYLFRDMD